MHTFGRSWTWTRPVLGVSLVIVALCVVGCGGTKTLSHQALVSQANKACGKADSAISQLGAPAASLTSLTTYARKVLPISKQLVQRLEALKPNSSSQAALNHLVAVLRNGNRGLEKLETATSPAQAAAASQQISSQSVPNAAKALGATTCAATPST